MHETHAKRLKHPDLHAVVETRCPSGHAQVLRCHPVRAPHGRIEPFPTLFWLVCPELSRALSMLEAAGRIAEVQRQLAADDAFRRALADDHDAYRRERWSLLDDGEIELLERRGFAVPFRAVGIGGMKNAAAVKCLHLHYAHHLARGNAIGRWLDERGMVEQCGGGREAAGLTSSRPRSRATPS